MRRASRFAAFVGLAASAGAPSGLLGHEIPSDVTVRVIVKPAGERLHVLVRAPLEAMQDIDFPTQGLGYLDLANADGALRNAALLWLANDVILYEGERRLPLALVAVRASLPSDRSFAGYETALAHIRGAPLTRETQIVWQQALLDVLLEAPIESDRALFSIHPRLARLGLQVTTAVQFVAADGRERVFQIDGDQGVLELDPRWHTSALRFLRQGFAHILDGADHLLFLLCLVVPFRRELKALVWIVTAFTAGHSVTLLGSAYGFAPSGLWFAPLIEALIAASIFYIAAENIVIAATSVERSLTTRWTIAAAFGLVHGFGFSFALRDSLQFAGDHALTALLAFNIGIELGQLLVLLLLVPALYVAFRYVIAERIGVIVLSVIVAHTAWHWLADRYTALRQFDIGWF